MNIRYYCVYDKRIESANLPFTAKSDDHAKEFIVGMLSELKNDSNLDSSILKNIKANCELRFSGEFQLDRGTFTVFDETVICDFSDPVFNGIFS